METIRRSDKIYAWANEYHVMGLGTFKRGWCLMELGVTEPRSIEDLAERYLIRFKKQSHFQEDDTIIQAPR